jgi:N-acetylglutamate synthase-like GNAT family acetyltransferase
MLLETRRLGKDEPIPYDLLLLADEEMQAIERYIHQSEIYVIEKNNKIIGVYALYPIGEHIAEIKAIAVDEAHQNQGIGKLLLKDAEMKAQEKGVRELIIGTPTIAQKQLAIYQKAGFERYDVKKDFFITYYSEPIFEGGIQLKDMAMLRKRLN